MKEIKALQIQFRGIGVHVLVTVAKVQESELWDHDFEKLSFFESVQVKFGYSEKATKFEKIFQLKFDVTE